MTTIASMIGVSALIFIAKGNPIGPFLMIGFSIVYGIISYSYAYYGEMITYLGMSAPMALVSLISWLRNPYRGNRSEVKIHRLKGKELWVLLLLSFVLSILFYWILKLFGTSNLLLSTFSVTTSCFAVCLTFRRSPYFALAYSLNDVVLIALWILASLDDISYLSMVICFSVFLVNDLYSFFNWKRMEKRQGYGV